MEGSSSVTFIDKWNQIVAAVLAGDQPLITAATMLWFLISHGGWIIIAYVAWKGFEYWWLLRIQTDYANKRQWIMLAIDVPRDNIQSPKAVENIFAHLAGAHSEMDYIDYWWTGVTQDYFSLEIVGIEGYVQFIIRTPSRYRDLVEAAIYAQYPEAQISEIEDYTIGYPNKFPNEKYDLYGTEFIPVQNQLYSIRTYIEFEHIMTKELKDPMTTLLETLNKLGAGEQVWLQLIIVPTNEKWKIPASSMIKKIMKADTARKAGIISQMVGEISGFGTEAQRQILGGEPGATKPERSQFSLSLLAPDDQARADGIARKIKKIGYFVKYRLIYIASKEKFIAAHGREAVIGAIKQFNTGDLNALKPDTKITGVHAHYFFVNFRKNIKKTKLINRYKDRSHYKGRETYILNTEELATLWHFPTKTETMPMRHMVQRTEFKHTPPPATLPTSPNLIRPGQHPVNR